MTKTKFITASGFAFFGVFSAWQFFQIRELKETNTHLAQKKAPAPVVNVPINRPAAQAARTGPASETITAVSVNTPEPAAADAERIAREARFREMREIDRAQRQDARVLNLTTKLNLTPEQQSKVREVLQTASAKRDALREAGDQRRRAGTQETDEERRANMMKIANVDLQQEEEIAALLSADQSTEYVNCKAEQKAQSDENFANQRLRELQDRFSLTEEQKEAAFQYFAKQEQEQGFDLSQVMAAGEDPMERARAMEKERLEALKAILTPEQFTLHSAQQAQREEMFRNMQPGGGSGGFGPRGNR